MFGKLETEATERASCQTMACYNLVMNGVDTYNNMRSRYGTFDHGNRVLEGST